MRFDTPLPIDDALPALAAALARGNNAVLVAPPGAGKTTRVPLALLEAPWCQDRRIIMLEPRRLAARGAAERMAKSLGEAVGATVGLRARLNVRVSARTRIEAVTEGVFARMILDDPALDGVAAVLFDEFHERSLDGDMGLALALDAQSGLRDDLRILVMSATLDGARVAGLLGDGTPVIESEGRMFPVETRYLGRDTRERLEPQVASAVLRALSAEPGSILAFLPGQGEIRRTEELLAERLRDPQVDLAPLYGAMDSQAQDLAVQPAPPGRRKVVLATAIAETSLTIEGVRVVVDSGLARVPRYEPDTGVTRLETVRVSKASADQRRGRAGRTEPGVCYRLWDEPQTLSLAPFNTPEIRAADLSGLMLDLAIWGVADPAQLRWLDPPPAAAVAEAKTMLTAIGAIDETGRITAQGRRIRALPLPPRLANMIIGAASVSAAALRDAADLAAILVERGMGGASTDLAQRLELFRRDRGVRAAEMRRLASGWADGLRASAPSGEACSIARLLALAYPDRMAKARGTAGQFLLANGRAGQVDAADPLARSPWCVVAEMTGTAAAARILAAAPMSEAEAVAIAGQRIASGEELTFDPEVLALRARRVRRLDAITLESQTMPVPKSDAAAQVLALGIAAAGIQCLPWSKATRQWRDRVMFLRRAHGAEADNPWPDLSDEALAASVTTWLAPFLGGLGSVSAIGTDALREALETLVPWNLRRLLDEEAPTHFEAPTGSSVALEYEAEGGPVLAIRVQELYGLKVHPALAGGRVPLTLHLLSPAHRPIQITRDLPGFWKGSWAAVKAEMKGRYPRHLWPDDPAAALPTARAKPRGT
ncbi:MAG: ATP-dependent helicase HrpB [Methylocystis sp.]|nr:ATP-dependent helicase HrpB [Methylocystis sp.]MCA3582960.1 ATP-dependent helicase HrpB [Methylocystis sp.]MCA3587283.1 ATP-dependent helicase HrpB [Methylocystis sp.]MCA3590365.1 ATP-dependent helicase HrpB [Methylocystis sp.]